MSKNLLRAASTAALLAASVAGNVAFAVYEIEPNDSINAAQRLVVDGSGNAEATGAIGDASGTPLVNDVDFYTFEGQQGDVVTIDTDGGIKGSGGGASVDTYLTLFHPNSTILRENSDSSFPVDAGSLSFRDARIDNVRLPVTGTYTVAVSAWSMGLWDGGILIPGTRAMSNGSYTLMISGVTPSMQQINIDIKPGSRGRIPHNFKARGIIPVALLSSPEFDALEVDEASVTFGPTGAEASARRCGAGHGRDRGHHGRDNDDDDRDRRHHRRDRRDVNGDGLADLVCYFRSEDTGFEPGDVEGVVMGRTATGDQFEGRAPLKILPSRRHKHK